jgi:hypothetical protein
MHVECSIRRVRHSAPHKTRNTPSLQAYKQSHIWMQRPKHSRYQRMLPSTQMGNPAPAAKAFIAVQELALVMNAANQGARSRRTVCQAYWPTLRLTCSSPAADSATCRTADTPPRASCPPGSRTPARRGRAPAGGAARRPCWRIYIYIYIYIA